MSGTQTSQLILPDRALPISESDIGLFFYKLISILIADPGLKPWLTMKCRGVDSDAASVR